MSSHTLNVDYSEPVKDAGNFIKLTKIDCVFWGRALLIVLGLFALIILGLIIYRFWKGEISFGDKVFISENKENRKLKNQLKQKELIHEKEIEAGTKKANLLNEDAELKSNLLKEFWAINLNICRIIIIEDLKIFNEEIDRLLEFILSSINSNFTKGKDDWHKVVLFTPQNKNKLKAMKSDGYPPDHHDKLVLDIKASAAGHAFKDQKVYICGDVTKENVYFKPVQWEVIDYFSLLCVPIQTNKKTWGVLSINGNKINAFSEDDIRHIQQYATMIGMIFLISERKTARIKEGG